MTLKKLGRYEVIRVLGKGAMGVVYEGRDPNLERRVAIKTVKVENLSEEAATEYDHRFRTEARSAARLQHPNIVSVYDSDRDGDIAFLVMEYIQGDDLKHHLDHGTRYPMEQSLRIIRDLLSALDYAHRQGIVHRDIKPANLLIEPGGRVKLTDFGVARIQDSGEATRTQGSMIGTLKYMAPEQVQGQKIDARADLFSAAVVLYQLLTEKRPFDGDNDFSIIHQIIGHNPPAPSTINARLPPALDAVMERALAKSRDDRYPTARDFAVALQAATRRGDDQSTVPPLNPVRSGDPSSPAFTVAGTVPPSTPTSPSASATMTQELELVYWKDVKESSDPEELQGFLEKFPAGIYADLARRRLRKLSGGDQTLLSQPGLAGTGTFTATQFPDSSLSSGSPSSASELRPVHWVNEEYTTTLLQPGSAAGQASSGSDTLPLGSTAGKGGAASAQRAGEPVSRTAYTATEPISVAAALATADATATRAASDPTRPMGVPSRKTRFVVLAGVAVVCLAGVLAVVLGPGRDALPGATLAAVPGAPAQAATAAGPWPAAARAVPAEPPPALAVNAATSAVPPAATGKGEAAKPVAGSAAKTESQAARQGARHAKPTKSAAPPTPEAPRTSVAAAAVSDAEPARVQAAASQVSVNAASAAVDQCKDKFFLARELCLVEQCGRASARTHPACVRYREEVRLRDEARQQQQQR